MPGLRTLVLAIAKCNQKPPVGSSIDLDHYNAFARGLTDDQMDTFALIVQHGLACFNYFAIEQYDQFGNLCKDSNIPPLAASQAKGDKDDAMDGFAGVLYVRILIL